MHQKDPYESTSYNMQSRTEQAASNIESLLSSESNPEFEGIHSFENAKKRWEITRNRLTGELGDALDHVQRLENQLYLRDRQAQEERNNLEEQANKQQFESGREIAKLQAKLDGLNVKLDGRTEYEERIQSLTSRHDSLVVHLNSKIDKLKAKLKQALDDPMVQMLKTKLESEKAERSKILRESEKMQIQIRDLEVRFDAKEHEANELKNELEDRKREVKAVCREKENITKDVQKIKISLESAEREIRNLTKSKEYQLEQMNDELKVGQKKMDQMQSEKRKMQLELDNLKMSANHSMPPLSRSAYSSASLLPLSPSTTGSSALERNLNRRSSLLSNKDFSLGGDSTSSILDRTSESSRSREPRLTHGYRASHFAEPSSLSSSNASISKYQNQITRLERENEHQVMQWENKIREAEMEIKRLQSYYDNEKIQRQDMENLMKQDKQESKETIDLALEKVALFTKQLADTQAEINKHQKALIAKDHDLDNIRMQFEQVTFNMNQTKNALKKLELQHRQREDAFQNTDRRLKESESQCEKLSTKLVNTTEELEMMRQNLEDSRAEIAQNAKIHEAHISALEEEIYEETMMKEKLQHAVNGMNQEISTLLWYFKPLEEQSSPDQAKYQTFEHVFKEKMLKEREDELVQLAQWSQGLWRIGTKSVVEMQELLKSSLSNMPDDVRDVVSFEFKDLMKYMNEAKIRTKVKLFIFVTLAENAVDPGIIRELANITCDMAQGKNHMIYSPESLIKFSLVDSVKVRDKKKAFRTSILNRLGALRATRTKKDIEYCKIVILEGGEYDD